MTSNKNITPGAALAALRKIEKKAEELITEPTLLKEMIKIG